MELEILGCHGGETVKHRPPAFLVDGRLAVDAGSITGMLTLQQQCKIEVVMVSHAHLDHVRDLALLADSRAQLGGPPITVVSTAGTVRALKRHLFNDRLWPDFTKIPSSDKPTVIYQTIKPEKPFQVAGFTVKAVPVDHTVETTGFVISDGNSSFVYSGDTGPTERLWQVVEETDDLAALIVEVAFPNGQAELALKSGHHTPKVLAEELRKLGTRRDLPILLFHIKPAFQRQVERELARIRRSSVRILQLGDRFTL